MKTFALFFAALLGLASCSPPAPESLMARAPSAEVAFDQVSAKQAPAEPAPEGAPSANYESRKQVKTGSVVLESSDPAAVEASLTAKLKAVGGFVETSFATPNSRSLTVRIPAAEFDVFLEGLSSWGKLTQRQVTVSDVTMQYYDLQTRLKNQRLLLDQYRGFLAQTKKMDEILDAMGRISELTTQIESTEGQFRYLSRQVGFSTLSVELTSPLLSTGRSWPDWDRGLSEVIHNVADFAVGTVFFLLTSLVVVPVAAAFIALAVWLLLGRPGLWRRLKGLRHRPKPGFSETQKS